MEPHEALQIEKQNTLIEEEMQGAKRSLCVNLIKK